MRCYLEMRSVDDTDDIRVLEEVSRSLRTVAGLLNVCMEENMTTNFLGDLTTDKMLGKWNLNWSE